MIQCPHCKEKVTQDNLETRWHPTGREANCPLCGKKFYLAMVITNPRRDRPKMTKKERRRARAQK